MRVLVTGGSGFVGRNLVEHLAHEHIVLAPAHSELDLTDDRAVDRWFWQHEVDAVIHAAVRPGHRAVRDTSRQLWSNLRMFFSIVRNHDRFGRLVFISSGAVYDTRQSLERVAEEKLGASIPEDEHGLAKYVIAQYLDASARQVDVPAVELRLFGVFGKHEDYRIRFISNAICRALLGLPVTLRQDRRFSYLYIADLLPVVDWALGGQQAHIAYNVSPDWTDTLGDLASVVVAHSAVEVPILIASEGTGKEYTADNRRLRAEMPNLSFTAPALAIDRLWAWYADRLHLIDRDELEVFD